MDRTFPVEWPGTTQLPGRQLVWASWEPQRGALDWRGTWVITKGHINRGRGIFRGQEEEEEEREASVVGEKMDNLALKY